MSRSKKPRIYRTFTDISYRELGYCRLAYIDGYTPYISDPVPREQNRRWVNRPDKLRLVSYEIRLYTSLRWGSRRSDTCTSSYLRLCCLQHVSRPTSKSTEYGDYNQHTTVDDRMDGVVLRGHNTGTSPA